MSPASCLCHGILDEDKARHFKECPHRQLYPAVGPFEILFEKGDEGYVKASVTLPGEETVTSALGIPGERAERAIKQAFFYRLAEMAGSDAPLPPEVEALFSRRFA